MEDLQCNIVVMKKSQPKVLRLNLVGSPKKNPQADCPLPSTNQSSETNKKQKLISRFQTWACCYSNKQPRSIHRN
ncbi:hypothetical protein Hanom_Chr16g01469651 [Helianthus anomalus]